jgi:hypothetical protein
MFLSNEIPLDSFVMIGDNTVTCTSWESSLRQTDAIQYFAILASAQALEGKILRQIFDSSIYDPNMSRPSTWRIGTVEVLLPVRLYRYLEVSQVDIKQV